MGRFSANTCLAAAFLVLTGCGSVVFATRIGAREFGSKAFLASPAGRFVLRGGASDIGGTPKRPKDFRQRIEWETTQNIPLRIPVLEAAARFNDVIGWNVPTLAPDYSPYRLDGAFWSRSHFRTQKQLRSDYFRTLDLLRFIARRELPVLYVKPPVRVSPDDRLFKDVFDFSDSLGSQVVAELEKRGISCLDLEKELEADGLGNHAAYYGSDHHFTVATALWAARKIVRELDGLGLANEFDKTMLEEQAYSLESIPGGFFGSIGRRVTAAVCPPDPFVVPHVLSDMSFTIDGDYENGHHERTTGNGEVLLGRDRLLPASPYKTSYHAVFLRGNRPCTTVRNHANPGGPKLLLFGDSFDNEIAMFLACGASLVTTIDDRDGTHAVPNLLGDQPYDAAIVLYARPPPPRGLRRRLKPGGKGGGHAR